MVTTSAALLDAGKRQRRLQLGSCRWDHPIDTTAPSKRQREHQRRDDTRDEQELANKVLPMISKRQV